MNTNWVSNSEEAIHFFEDSYKFLLTKVEEDYITSVIETIFKTDRTIEVKHYFIYTEELEQISRSISLSNSKWMWFFSNAIVEALSCIKPSAFGDKVNYIKNMPNKRIFLIPQDSIKQWCYRLAKYYFYRILNRSYNTKAYSFTLAWSTLKKYVEEERIKQFEMEKVVQRLPELEGILC